MIKIDRKRLDRAVSKSTQQIAKVTPIILGIILLISLAIVSIKNTDYSSLFTKNPIIDPLIGAMLYYFGLTYTIVLTIVMIIMSVANGITVKKLLDLTQ